MPGATDADRVGYLHRYIEAGTDQRFHKVQSEDRDHAEPVEIVRQTRGRGLGPWGPLPQRQRRGSECRRGKACVQLDPMAPAEIQLRGGFRGGESRRLCMQVGLDAPGG